MDYNKVHVLRLASGKSFALTAPSGDPIVDARIEVAGHCYAYNLDTGANRGRVFFTPFSQVVEKLH
jgi:hypothetical protein